MGDKLDGDYAVGVARNSPGTLDAWLDRGYYRCTERDLSGNGQFVESVTAFPDVGYPVSKTSGEATWRLMFTHGINSPDDQSIRFSTKALDRLLGDTTLVDSTGFVQYWSTPAANLFTYLAGDSTAWGTYATEYLRAGGVDFLATYDGTGILVSRMLWNGTDFSLQQPSVADVGDVGWRRTLGVAMRLAQAAPGAGRIRFAIQLPSRQRVRFGIYDIAGRRVRALFDGEMPSGTIPVEWDGRDEAGNSVRTGMYFARLSGEFGHRVVRAAFIR